VNANTLDARRGGAGGLGGGGQLELAHWRQAAIPAKSAGAVVVGIERPPVQLGCPYTLKLWEAQGPRTISLGNTTFPASGEASRC